MRANDRAEIRGLSTAVVLLCVMLAGLSTTGCRTDDAPNAQAFASPKQDDPTLKPKEQPAANPPPLAQPAKKQLPLAAPNEQAQMEEIVKLLRSKGTTRVIVRLKGNAFPPVEAPKFDARATRSSLIGRRDPRIEQMREGIAAAQTRLLGRLDGSVERRVHRFQRAPYLAMDMRLEDALALQSWMKETPPTSDQRPFEIWVEADGVLKLQSTSATAANISVDTVAAYMGFDTAAASTTTGSTVVIIDDRIDEALHLLHDRVDLLYEVSPSEAVSPVTKNPAAEPPVYAPSHGTKVALIVTRAAPSAKLIGIDILGTADKSSQERLAKALELVLTTWPATSTRKVAAVCVSLGDESLYTSGQCDCLADPRYSGCASLNPLILEYVNQLAYEQIPVVIAAGNKAPYDNYVFHPACLTTAITVGATTGGVNGSTIERAGVSNWGTLLDVCAQGENLEMDLDDWMNPPGPAPAKLFGSGSSFAAPFVCAAYSVLLDSHKEWNNDRIGTALRQGEDVTCWGVTVPELRLKEAWQWLDANPPTGSSPGPQ